MADTKPVLMKISDTCILGMVNDVPVLQLDWDPIAESLMYYTYDENTQNGKPTGWHEWHYEEAASLIIGGFNFYICKFLYIAGKPCFQGQ